VISAIPICNHRCVVQGSFLNGQSRDPRVGILLGLPTLPFREAAEVENVEEPECLYRETSGQNLLRDTFVDAANLAYL
jgi:hypothetical protein